MSCGAGFYSGRDFPLGKSWQAPREGFDWRTKRDVTQADLWLAGTKRDVIDVSVRWRQNCSCMLLETSGEGRVAVVMK